MPLGVEIVTVAMDTKGPDAARQWIELAKPEHPALIDAGHVLGEKLGIVNVPMSAWIDEKGTLVRVADAAFTQESPIRNIEINDAMPEALREVLTEAKKIEANPAPYLAALRDWAEKGAESKFALSPEEVVRRSRPRSADEALATANFEMGQHLYRAGHKDDAVSYWREAHRLHPGNWTYKRQAWSIADPNQGPTREYEGSWLKDVKAIGGGQNYYPRFQE